MNGYLVCGDLNYDYDGLLFYTPNIEKSKLIGYNPVSKFLTVLEENTEAVQRVAEQFSAIDESSNPVIAIYHPKEEWR